MPLHFNWELFHVALSHVSPLSHVLPCFPILMLSSLHLVIFRYPYLIHTKSDFRIFLCYEFNTSFSSHLPISFSLEKKILSSNFEKILWSNNFLKVPPCRNCFVCKSRWYFLLKKPWALNLDNTTIPFLHFGILQAYPPKFY
jgi:hypothetical protein